MWGKKEDANTMGTNAYESVKKDIEERFVELAKESFGSDLYAILLYGSAARGSYRPGVSDINVLVLHHQASPSALFLFGQKAGALIRKRNITPLFMTREEFLRSADVYPLEYVDIRNAHKVLYGPDDTVALDLRLLNLRHQTEERLRGTLNQLRQILVASSGKPKTLSAYLRAWSAGSNALFRALLLLKGKDPNVSDPERLALDVEELYQLPPTVFSRFERFRRGEKLDPLTLATDLLRSLEALVRSVDELTEAETGGAL